MLSGSEASAVAMLIYSLPEMLRFRSARQIQVRINIPLTGYTPFVGMYPVITLLLVFNEGNQPTHLFAGLARVHQV